MGHLSEAIGYLNVSLKYGTIFFCVLYFCNIRKKEKTAFDILIYYFFDIYIFTVLAVTRVIGDYNWKFEVGSFASFSDLFSKEKILNTIMFLPLGVFLPYVVKKCRWYICVLIGFSFSVIIECIQWLFVGRLADVTDVFANTLGCVLGVIVFYFLKRMYVMHSEQKKIGFGTFSAALNFVMFIISVPFFMNKLCVGDFLIGNLLSYKLTWSECNIQSMEFSGIHYTIIYIFVISLGSLYLSKKNSFDLFSKVAEKTAVILLLYLVLLIFCQMF